MQRLDEWRPINLKVVSPVHLQQVEVSCKVAWRFLISTVHLQVNLDLKKPYFSTAFNFLNSSQLFQPSPIIFFCQNVVEKWLQGEPGTRMPQPTSSNFSEGIPSEGQRFSLITLHQGHRRSVGGAGNFDRMTFGRIAGKTSFIHISRPHLKLTIALFYSSFQLSISSMQ